MAKKDVWLMKEDAAKLLGVGIRQLENRVARGKVRKQTLQREPGERTARVCYAEEDLKALLAGTPNQYEPPAAPQSRTLAITNGAPGDPFAGMPEKLAALAAFASQFKAPEPKFWLTVDEAIAVSGLPREYLIAQARSGAFRAVNVGRGKREFWRFNREGLAR
jgi:hypothetical protein